jgi:hypothetical protein
MSLDLWQDDIKAADARATRSPASEVPAGFGDTFAASWDHGVFFGQSIARANSRTRAMEDFIGDVYRRTGTLLPNPELAAIGTDGLAAFNTELEKLAFEHPALGRLKAEGAEQMFVAVTNDEIDKLAAQHAARVRIDYQTAMARERTWGGTLGMFAGSALPGVGDPINLVAFPLSAPVSLGVIGTTAAWAGIAGGTQFAIELAGAPFRAEVQPGYTPLSGESLGNVLEAGAFGGVLGGGLKGIANAWTRIKTGQWPRSIRDHGNIVESENNVAVTNPDPSLQGQVDHRTALQKSIDDMVGLRPVDVSDEIGPVFLANYNMRLTQILEPRAAAVRAGETAIIAERNAARMPHNMERLSEAQLEEIRRTRDQIELDRRAGLDEVTAAQEALQTERAALTTRRTGAEADRATVEGLRADLERVRRQQAEARPPTNPITQARLDTIETDLKQPNLGRETRQLLEGERAQITETLAKTQAGDAKLLASLEQEAKGLTKGLATAEKRLAKTEAALTRGEERAVSREGQIARTADQHERQTAAKSEALRHEMRRAVHALATEGYGLRLSRTEAQAMADNLLNAPADEVTGAIRGVTEYFVDLRQQVLAGPQMGGAQTRAVAAQFTDETRRAIQKFAADVGVIMPDEEAAVIAARLATVSEKEALFILDELMLRPRTLADTLPGVEKLQREAADPRGAPGGVTRTDLPTPPRPTAEAPQPMLQSMAKEVTPEAMAKARTSEETMDGVILDMDRLRAERGKDVEYPDPKTGELKSLDNELATIEAREKAAAEIEACSKPTAEAAE